MDPAIPPWNDRSPLCRLKNNTTCQQRPETTPAEHYLSSNSPVQKLGLLRRDDRWESFLAGDESHGDRIDAVASVLGGHSFTLKNMPQVAAAIPANNFGAISVRVLMTINGFGDLVIEAGPTAMAFELVVGSVKRRVAQSANKRAHIFQIRVLAGE